MLIMVAVTVFVNCCSSEKEFSKDLVLLISSELQEMQRIKIQINNKSDLMRLNSTILRGFPILLHIINSGKKFGGNSSKDKLYPL